MIEQPTDVIEQSHFIYLKTAIWYLSYALASNSQYTVYIQNFEACNFCESTNFSGYIFEDPSFFMEITYLKHRANPDNH